MLRVLGELGVSGEDYKLCERALEVYRANLYSDSGAPWGGGECLLAESTTLRGMWCWDTAFHAIGISRFDVDFAARQLEMFMQFQRDDGMFYDAVFCDGRVSAGFSGTWNSGRHTVVIMGCFTMMQTRNTAKKTGRICKMRAAGIIRCAGTALR